MCEGLFQSNFNIYVEISIETELKHTRKTEADSMEEAIKTKARRLTDNTRELEGNCPCYTKRWIVMQFYW